MISLNFTIMCLIPLKQSAEFFIPAVIFLHEALANNSSSQMPHPAPCYQYISFFKKSLSDTYCVYFKFIFWPQNFAVSSIGYSACFSFIPVTLLYILSVFQIHQLVSHSVVYPRSLFWRRRSFVFQFLEFLCRSLR